MDPNKEKTKKQSADNIYFEAPKKSRNRNRNKNNNGGGGGPPGEHGGEMDDSEMDDSEMYQAPQPLPSKKSNNNQRTNPQKSQPKSQLKSQPKIQTKSQPKSQPKNQPKINPQSNSSSSSKTGFKPAFPSDQVPNNDVYAFQQSGAVFADVDSQRGTRIISGRGSSDGRGSAKVYTQPKSARQINQEQEHSRQNHQNQQNPQNEQQSSSTEQMSAMIDRMQLNPEVAPFNPDNRPQNRPQNSRNQPRNQQRDNQPRDNQPRDNQPRDNPPRDNQPRNQPRNQQNRNQQYEDPHSENQLNQPRRSNNRRIQERLDQRAQNNSDRRGNTTAQFSNYTHSHVADVAELTAQNRRQKTEANKPRNQRTNNRKQNREQRNREQSGDPNHQNHRNNRKPSNEPTENLDPESIEKMKLKLKEISSISPENLNQMDKLISNLSKQNYECLICMNNVKHHQAIWGCQTCYAIFHIFCIKKWAKNSLEQQSNTQTPSELPKWRCPGCQTETATEPPNAYSCFCGKHKDPVHVLGAIPHSCGQICGKKSRICEHNCSSLCHPGPCPDCENYTTQTCPCDEENKRQVKCKATVNSIYTCEETCGRLLNCGEHFCDRDCHTGDCHPCNVKIDLDCFSHGKTKEWNCNQNEGWKCDDLCGKVLECGHLCDTKCHDGDCPGCSINKNKFCFCGKVEFDKWSCKEERKGCGQQCGQKQLCGHHCELDCHDGECLPCDDESFVHRKCRCSKSKVKISCIDLVEQNGLVLCHRACKKMNSCNNPRHRCKNVCCTENHDAQCLIPCGAKLSCKEHSCPEACHFGRSCLPCMNITWTELSCRCGSQKLLPPIACGADIMISCNAVCPEKRACGHSANHKCHDLRSECAPCVEFVEKPCVCGKVESVKTHCWQKDKNVSCGQICGIKMDCGHICNKPCHDHEKETVKCALPCIKPRPDCKHECGKTCHYPEACLHEEVYCSKRVKVFCQCGFVSRVLDCGAPEWKTNQASIFRNRDTYYKLVKARSMRNERFDENKKMSVLQCDDTCLKHTRNEALRQALEIPDARSKVEYDTWRQEYHNNLCYD